VLGQPVEPVVDEIGGVVAAVGERGDVAVGVVGEPLEIVDVADPGQRRRGIADRLEPVVAVVEIGGAVAVGAVAVRRLVRRIRRADAGLDQGQAVGAGSSAVPERSL